MKNFENLRQSLRTIIHKIHKRDLRILLVYPQYRCFATAPPLGLAYIAAVLDKNNYKVEILDLGVSENVDLEETLKLYDIIGIGFMTPMASDAIDIAMLAHNLGKFVIVGGPHATAVPDEMLKTGHIDVVVRGEGEITFLEVIKTLEKKGSMEMVSGISYLANGKTYHSENRPFIKNLDTIPFPARNLLSLYKYNIAYAGFDPNFPVTSVIASRGCPGRCIFCASRIIFGHEIRIRSSKNIVDEIEDIVNRFGITQFNFSDDSFTVSEKMVIGFCKELMNRDVKIKWACSTRGNMLSKDVLSIMKHAGCIRVGIGIESANSQILKNIKKNITIGHIQDSLRLLYESGIPYPVGYFMVGNPGDDNNTIQDTINFIKNNPQLYASVSMATPFPGTEFFNYVKSKNHIRTLDWKEFVTTSGVSVVRTDSLDYTDCLAAFSKINLTIGQNEKNRVI